MAKLCPTCGNSYDDRNVFCPADGSTLRTSGDAADLIGSVIADRYLITEKLGEGGMGRVYLAQHVRLPQQAAIKVLHPTLVHDPDALARFNHEASNACRINDTHVARVYDFGETGNGLVYLAMEYVPGETLNELLKKGAPFAPRRAAALTQQIAAGLDAAHKLGIVHRDMKPDNILVMRDADGEELVKVVDFGIAKAIDANTQHVTRTGFVLGTAQYMSPEQVAGRIVDRRSDVYALGLVAFMMLTGKLPFPAETAEEAMVKRLNENPRTLAQMQGGVSWPAAVQEVFDGALARDLDQRYPTAGAFGKALADAIDGWIGGAVPASATFGGRPASARQVTGKGAERAGTAPSQSAVGGPRRRRLIAFVGTAVAASIIAALVLLPIGGSDAAGSRLGVDGDTSGGTVDTSKRTPPPDSNPGPEPDENTTGNGRGRRGGDSLDDARGRRGGEREPTPPPPPRPSADALAARRELDRVRAGLDTAAINEPIARAAIASIVALLPRLGTAHDTLTADLARASAHLYLGEFDNTCAILRPYRTRASAELRSSVDELMGIAECRP
jgi:serine/threonine-protein kinase